MGKLIDTDGLETVLTAANNTFLKNSGGTVTGNIVFTGSSGQINGYDIEGTTGNRWGIVPIVEKNVGAMEVGSRIRFHTSDTDTTAGAVELQASSSGELTLNGDVIIDGALNTNGNTTINGTLTLPQYKDGTITRNETNCSTLGTSWISKKGYMISVSFIDAKITNALANGSDVVIATLPAGFRPRANRYLQCVEKAGLWARITASGEVRIANRTGASYAAKSTVTFSDSFWEV